MRDAPGRRGGFPRRPGVPASRRGDLAVRGTAESAPGGRAERARPGRAARQHHGPMPGATPGLGPGTCFSSAAAGRPRKQRRESRLRPLADRPRPAGFGKKQSDVCPSDCRSDVCPPESGKGKAGRPTDSGKTHFIRVSEFSLVFPAHVVTCSGEAPRPRGRSHPRSLPSCWWRSCALPRFGSLPAPCARSSSPLGGRLGPRLSCPLVVSREPDGFTDASSPSRWGSGGARLGRVSSIPATSHADVVWVSCLPLRGRGDGGALRRGHAPSHLRACTSVRRGDAGSRCSPGAAIPARERLAP